jgi:nitroreductase
VPVQKTPVRYSDAAAYGSLEEFTRLCLDRLLAELHPRLLGRPVGQPLVAGHAGQHFYLQAESLGLGACAVGAFSPTDVAILLNLPEDEEPIYLYPIGRV